MCVLLHLQEPPPLTEDLIEEQQRMLMQLGASNDPQAQRLKAELQGAHLRSDMQAFKAANPGATLADFVRYVLAVDWLWGLQACDVIV